MLKIRDFQKNVGHPTFSHRWWWWFCSSEIWCIVDCYKGESAESGGSKVLRNQCAHRNIPEGTVACSLSAWWELNGLLQGSFFPGLRQVLTVPPPLSTYSSSPINLTAAGPKYTILCETARHLSSKLVKIVPRIARVEVLVVVIVKKYCVLGMISCSMIKIYRHCGEIYGLHLQVKGFFYIYYVRNSYIS